MKASAARDIVFAHAIETAAPHEALPTPARRDAITQETLHALGAPQGAAGRGAFAAFLQARAQRVMTAAQLPADVRHVWQSSAALTRWIKVAVPIVALVVGYVGHAVTDPHRVDLLSPSLIGIVLWNVLMYGVLLLGGLGGWLRRRPKPLAALEPVQATTSAAMDEVAPTGWLHRLQAKRWRMARGAGLRGMALQFERNWWRLNASSRQAQWLMCLHLGAAMLALGALASLWVTGLTKAYQVGWESTFLTPVSVHQGLNALFAPVQALWGTAPWTLAEISALQGWKDTVAAPAAGQRWVIAYTALLGLLVVLPRCVLALWQGARAAWLQRHMALPLQQPYFQKLQRDWAGRATALCVWPYSLDMTPERLQGLQQHVAVTYGAGAKLSVLPTLAYGANVPVATAAEEPVQQILLLNFAATPEAEVHGALLAQVRERWGAQTDVWLWAADFRARNAGAPARVPEREQLWRALVEGAGLHATVVPHQENRA